MDRPGIWCFWAVVANQNVVIPLGMTRGCGCGSVVDSVVSGITQLCKALKPSMEGRGYIEEESNSACFL